MKASKIINTYILLLFVLTAECSYGQNVLILYNDSWGNNGTFNCVRNYANTCASQNINFTLCPTSGGGPSDPYVVAPACVQGGNINNYDAVLFQNTYSYLVPAFNAILVNYVQNGGNLFFQVDPNGTVPTAEIEQDLNDLLAAISQPSINFSGLNTTQTTETLTIGGSFASSYNCPQSPIFYNTGGFFSGPAIGTASLTASYTNGISHAFWDTGFGGVLGFGAEFYSSGNWAGDCTPGSGQLVWGMMNPANMGCTVNAEFEISDDIICVTECVDLIDASSTTCNGTVNSWSYQINGGTPATSTVQNPTGVCFNTPGTFPITLTVTDNLGNVDDTTMFITVEAICDSLVPDFIPSELIICEGQCIDFANTTTSYDPVVQWNWIFNGASTPSSTAQDPTNICYPTAGTYDVTLTATTTTGLTDDTTYTITVVPPPTASWTPPTNVCTGGADISLDALITGSTGGMWSGSEVTGPNQNIFSPPNVAGTYDVTYTVGVGSCIDTETHTITVGQSTSGVVFFFGSLCSTDAPVDLTNFTFGNGSVGGTYSGVGVTGTFFDPSVGTQTITYTAPGACAIPQSNAINVISADPSWVSPATLCPGDPDVNLNNLITGTSGGSWSGTGVSGNDFDPSFGTQLVTYAVGSPTCPSSASNTIIVDPCILPVEFEQFNGIPTQGGIQLEWSTLSEVNSSHFTIDHLVDGDFELLGTVDAKGNTQQRQVYSLLDVRPADGINYYKLTAIDIDGTISYTEIISVDWSIQVVKVFPNPASNVISIEIPFSGEKTIRLIAMDGKVLREEKSEDQKIIWGIENLAGGAYQVQIMTQNEIMNDFFMKRD